MNVDWLIKRPPFVGLLCLAVPGFALGVALGVLLDWAGVR